MPVFSGRLGGDTYWFLLRMNSTIRSFVPSHRHSPIWRIVPSAGDGFSLQSIKDRHMSSATTAEVARLRAEERFKKTALREREAAEARRFQEERGRAETAKVERLRALRLARDAEQAETAARRQEEKRLAAETAAEQPVAPKRKRRVAAAAEAPVEALADTAEAES
jgi:hypothetical protein